MRVWWGEYSRAMIRTNSELVNTLYKYRYLKIGHKRVGAREGCRDGIHAKIGACTVSTGYPTLNIEPISLVRLRVYQDLFGDDAVGPFDQRNENGRIAELCVPIRKIVFRDPTGPGASSSSEDRNVFGDDLLAQFAERRPTNGNDRVRGSFAHKIIRVSSQEYLNFVASVRQRQCMREHERRRGWVVGAPRTSHQDLQSFFRLLCLRSQCQKRETQQLRQEFASGHAVFS